VRLATSWKAEQARNRWASSIVCPGVLRTSGNGAKRPNAGYDPIVLRRALFLTLVASLSACAPACGNKNADEGEHEPEAAGGPISIPCVPATKGAIDRFVELRGRVSTKPGGTLTVESLVPGFVVELRVSEGERVKQGAVVAIVDDLTPRGEATQAQAAVARAVATKVQTGSALDRAKKLYNDGIVSKADVESAQAADDAAKGDLAAQEAVSNIASGNLKRIDVKSSFDGIVTKILRGPGALVDGINGNSPTPIVEIASDDSLEFVGDTTERDLELLAIGEKADLVLSANSAALHGQVVFVPRAVDLHTGLGEIRILLDKPGGGTQDRVRIGAFGHARVRAQPLNDAISIPRAALRGAVLDGAEVAVCADGKASIRKITVGYRDTQRLEVLSGLEAGEHVAVGDVLGISEGTAINESAPSAAPSSSETAPP